MRKLGPLICPGAAAGETGGGAARAGWAGGTALRAGASGAGWPVGTALFPNKLANGEAGVAPGGGVEAAAAGGEKAAKGEAGVSAPPPKLADVNGETCGGAPAGAGAGLGAANMPPWAGTGPGGGDAGSAWSVPKGEPADGAAAAEKGLVGKAGAWLPPPGRVNEAGTSRGMSASGGGGPLRLGGRAVAPGDCAEKGLAADCAAWNGEAATCTGTAGPAAACWALAMSRGSLAAGSGTMRGSWGEIAV